MMSKTIKKHKLYKNNTSKKPHVSKIHGKLITEKDGWVVLQIYGDPFQRGFAHGRLLKSHIEKVRRVLYFFIKNELKISVKKYMGIMKKYVTPVVKPEYPEFYQEITGISKGSGQSFDNIMAWNAYLSIYSYLKDGPKQRCSAFIATGNATKNGDIIMAHTTHTNFADGQLCNIMLYISPTSGYSFVMQTQPGLIYSGTDWFLSSSGIIGCETTIGGIKYQPKIKYPMFCRIRQCMQYAQNFDEYVETMCKQNGGDYPCSWLLGNIQTNEIMLFEIGQKETHIKRTKNGFYYGMNSVVGDKMRAKEMNDTDIDDILTSSGNRNVRFQQLLGDIHKGSISVENAKDIIADHYDTHMQRQDLNTRGICRHSEFDVCSKKEPNYMYGSTDAKVVNTEMATRFSFMARLGSGCGRHFSVKEHVKKYPQYKEWMQVVDDFQAFDWTEIHM